jgi:hypothetical protein
MFYHIFLYLFNLVPLKVYILTMDTTRGVIDKLAFIALIAYLNKQIFFCRSKGWQQLILLSMEAQVK